MLFCDTRCPTHTSSVSPPTSSPTSLTLLYLMPCSHLCTTISTTGPKRTPQPMPSAAPVHQRFTMTAVTISAHQSPPFCSLSLGEAGRLASGRQNPSFLRGLPEAFSQAAQAPASTDSRSRSQLPAPSLDCWGRWGNSCHLEGPERTAGAAGHTEQIKGMRIVVVVLLQYSVHDQRLRESCSEGRCQRRPRLSCVVCIVSLLSCFALWRCASGLPPIHCFTNSVRVFFENYWNLECPIASGLILLTARILTLHTCSVVGSSFMLHVS